jgi:cold shock CspA family protein
MNGTVLTFDRARGWGWAMPDDRTDDIYLHRLNLQPDRKYLNPGDRISYELGEHDGKPCAVNIRYLGHPIAIQVSGKGAQS